jgi:hypothetical protein
MMGFQAFETSNQKPFSFCNLIDINLHNEHGSTVRDFQLKKGNMFEEVKTTLSEPSRNKGLLP